MTINLPKKIAIIGVGLIGGSIALGLKKALGDKISVSGSCSDLKRAQRAQKMGIIDEIISPDKRSLTDCSLVIISTPINSVITTVKQLIPLLAPNTLMIDVSSTKRIICEEINKFLPVNLFFLGTHPMAGSELSGFENASADLFTNKPWIVCPNQETRRNNLLPIKSLIQILKAKPIIMTPAQHDKLVAWASHLFLIVSSILVSAVSKQSRWEEIARIASTGFCDTTRLASHDPDLKTEIIKTNKKNITDCLLKVRNEIDDFIILLEQNRFRDIRQYMNKTKSVRDNYLNDYCH
ncbi:prephenate dehydrogenase [Candidatus Microgenomates bacterium]|nr:prephenate dehydrogenase [Candidatus Microgenomates bacterium]